MIRTTLLWALVTAISVYAWRDWYKALCGLILMMAVVQHPDVPSSVLGIPGLNPWNIALLSIVVAWLTARRQEGLTWDLPGHVVGLLCVYLAVMLVSSARMMADREVLHETISYLVGEHFINVFKWVVPALLLYDGCRSRERFRMATFSILAVYVLLAVQVVRWVPISYAMHGDLLEQRAHKIIGNEVGYHRVNMSMMLAGASWAIFCARVVADRRAIMLAMIPVSLFVLLGQSLTAGRTGYATWAVVGLTLCMIRWKRYLLLMPALAVAVLTFIPGVSQRMFSGFSEETVDTNSRIEAEAVTEVSLDGGHEPDLYTITSGRNFAWPFVIEAIKKQPIVGYGKLAMRRTGLTDMLFEEYGEAFPHPHNAYLEMLFDAGVIGFLCVVPFYGLVLFRSLSLFRDSRSPIFVAAGGVAAALTLALLVAAMGSQTFYPREGSVGMWCAIALMLRVHVERTRAEAAWRDAQADETPRPAKVQPARPALRFAAGRPVPAPGVHRVPNRPATGANRVPSRSATAVNLDRYLWRNAA
jgi:O-antigen ligase